MQKNADSLEERSENKKNVTWTAAGEATCPSTKATSCLQQQLQLQHANFLFIIYFYYGVTPHGECSIVRRIALYVYPNRCCSLVTTELLTAQRWVYPPPPPRVPGRDWVSRWRDVLSLISGAPVEKSRILCPSDVWPHGRNALNSCVTNVCNAPLSKGPPDYVHANVGPLFLVQTCP